MRKGCGKGVGPTGVREKKLPFTMRLDPYRTEAEPDTTDVLLCYDMI